MKKRILSFIIVILLSITTYCPAYAAAIDTTSPYSGGYLLVINTSTDGNSSQQTGYLSVETTHSDQIDLYSADTTFEVMDINLENGAQIYQTDARDRLKAMKPVENDPDNIFGEEPFSTMSTSKYFYTSNFVTQAYESKNFNLKYSGIYCDVWLEAASPLNLTIDKTNQIGYEFDNIIYNDMITNFGPSYDRDGNQKITIILYDIQDGFNINTNPYYIGGFFDPSDLVGYNNNMDVLHIDTYPAMGLSDSSINLDNAKSIIVHEFQHLINFSYAYTNQVAEMPLWLDEGLSMAAQHMIYGALTSRISYYNNSNSIRNGHSLFYWDSNGDVLSNYALSYLFVQYLKTQTKFFAGGGNAIYKTLIQNSNRSSTAVKDVMTQFYPSITMDDILINFRIATVAKESTGAYGFMGETAFSSINTPLYTMVGGTIRGGGAVIKSKSSEFTPAYFGPNIKFVGFSKTVLSPPNANIASGTAVVSGSQVALSCSSGASIRYTTDGSTPTATTGIAYSGAITINKNMTIKAMAIESRMVDSEIVTFTYSLKAASPTASIASGTVAYGTVVDLSSSSSGATIRYTTDGSTPTATTGTIYSGPITLTESTTIKAIAIKSGIADSDVSTFTYTIIKVSNPVSSVESGTVAYGTVVELATSTSGAYIRYTTNGTTPTASYGNYYSSPITLTRDMTIKAIAFKYGIVNSDVSTFTYTVKVASPVASIQSGTFAYGTVVELSTLTNGATIRYTTDGSNPTATTGAVYSGPITLTQSMTIKAIAITSDVDSEVSTFTYSVKVVSPVASLQSGTVAYGTVVELSSSIDGAAIRYTTDGSTPTAANGKFYSAPIVLIGDTVIKAIAYKDGILDSDVITYSYTISNAKWKVNFGGRDSNSYKSVTATIDGYIAVGNSSQYSFGTGDWTGIAGKGGQDAIIVKHDLDGNIAWKKNFGGSGHDDYYSVANTSDGYIAVGYSYSNSFGNGDWTGVNGKGSIDAIIVKYDLDGNVIWKKNFGGSGDDYYNSIVNTPDGYIAVGVSNSFGNGDWTGVTGKGGQDAIIVKHDLDGNIAWKKNFGGSGSDSYNSIVTTTDGYVVVGNSYSNSFGTGDWTGVTGKGYIDAIIVKYGGDGNVIWKKNFGGSGSDSYNSIVSTSDGYVVVGNSYSNSFGNGDWTGATGKGSDDAIIIKYDFDGNIAWKKNIGGTGSDIFHCVVSATDGYIAVGASSSSSFGNGDWTGIIGKGSNDAIIVKFDMNGNVIRKQNFGGSQNDSLVSITKGIQGFVVAGKASSGSFGNGDWLGVTGKGYDDAVIVKYQDYYSTVSEPLAVLSYELYNNAAKLNLVPNEGGTYTVKARYLNTTGQSITASFALCIKSNNRMIDLQYFTIPQTSEQIINIEKEIILPSAPGLEIKLISLNDMETLNPMSYPIIMKDK